MIFADKLIQLRKKAGWSQEELADQLQVSRQAVSKWEGAQSMPDLEKLLCLSKMFGVSTDYLLKDEIEQSDGVLAVSETSEMRRVTMEEANAFLNAKAETSKTTAFATFLCVVSPICLLVLTALSQIPSLGLSEDKTVSIGLIVLLLLVTIAVTLFILDGRKTATFDFLENEIFEAEYGVREMVEERKKKYDAAYTRNNIIGTCLCIFAAIPIFVGLAFENDPLAVIMVAATLLLVGIGVMFFVRAGIVWASLQKLLQEGDYTKEKKQNPLPATIGGVYWLVATAIYLAYSFISNDWGRSWIVWPIAGVLFPAVLCITRLVGKKK